MRIEDLLDLTPRVVRLEGGAGRGGDAGVLAHQAQLLERDQSGDTLQISREELTGDLLLLQTGQEVPLHVRLVDDSPVLRLGPDLGYDLNLAVGLRGLIDRVRVGLLIVIALLLKTAGVGVRREDDVLEKILSVKLQSWQSLTCRTQDGPSSGVLVFFSSSVISSCSIFTSSTMFWIPLLE